MHILLCFLSILLSGQDSNLYLSGKIKGVTNYAT